MADANSDADGAKEQQQGGSSFLTAAALGCCDVGGELQQQWDNYLGARGCVGHDGHVRNAATVAAEVASTIGGGDGDVLVHCC